MWIPDYGNNRLLGFDGIPEGNNANATWVVGAPDFISTAWGTSATRFGGIQQGIEHEDRLYLLEYDNNRITIFDGVPLTPPATAANVIGQPDLDTSDVSCSASGLDAPETMSIVDGKLIVADSGNNRVLIWNTVPANADNVPADIVLGQGSMENCIGHDDDQDGSSDDPSARTLAWPSAAWSDGTRLVVLDGTSRVLIWNSFPESSFTPADIVLGQATFDMGAPNDDDQDGAPDSAPSARTLSQPYEGMWSNGLQLFVADTGNNRVLVWDSFPTENFQPADFVIGQSDFAYFTKNDSNQDGLPDESGEASARTFGSPLGLVGNRDKLLVIDEDNSRVLVFESQ